ncbi:MAG: OmpA family protein [Bacteroidales bacterium]|nr:OmpA family protein [Bacteroidales bacterium]
MKRLITILSVLLLAATLHAQEYTSSNKKAVAEYEKGRAALYKGKSTEALRCFEKAAEMDPSFCEPNLMLGEWYLDAGNKLLAKKHYAAAVAANAAFFPAAWLALGDMELEEGNNAKAEENYENALRYEKKDEDVQRRAQYGVDCARFRKHAMENPVSFHPENLGKGVNTQNDEYLPAITADGKNLIFTRRVPRRATTIANTPEEEDFYESQWQDDHWGLATRMAEPLNSNDNEGAQCISRDGRIMIFTACGRPDGAGRCDLYLCTRHGNQWTKPRNMGPVINTAGWESQPSLSYDGHTLYFASDRKGGYGGSDIWSSTLVDGQWTRPQNLGPAINTAGDENSPFIHFDNRTLYFSSTGHVGMGGSDLFLSRRRDDGSWSEPDNLGYPINTLGDESNLIVSADGTTAYFSSDKLGGEGRHDLYSFPLPLALQPEAVTYKEPADTLATLKAGESVALDNIFFETARWTLLETSKVALDHVAEALLKHPSLRVEIGGHTDNVGDEASNMHLSQQRAKAVHDYLVLRGVPPNRLSYRGYGETSPVADNGTDAGRAKNRRTTFTVISTKEQ